MGRKSEIKRKTNETDIFIALELDGDGKCEIQTGSGFFDHMLTALATHGGFNLTVKCAGDLHVDAHHTVEDVGIVLGKAFKEAVSGTKIARFGNAEIPMDDALASCALDICGRPFLAYQAEFVGEKTGDYENCLTKEFLQAFAFNAGITLHMRALYGDNDHHKNEAMFKSLAYALKQAIIESKRTLSSKGVLN